MVSSSEFLLRILEEALKRLYPLISRDEFAFCDGDFLLERAILLNELSLNDGKLFEIAFQEHHLLLLRAVVRCSEHVVILLTGLV